MASYYFWWLYGCVRGENDIMILVIVGFISGIISGMGIGGGTILIPALTLFLGIEQKMAQSINIMYFIPTATVALFTHIKAKRVEKSNIKSLILFGIIGAVIGSFGAMFISGSLLRSLFGIFLCVMAVTEIYKGIKG